MTPQLLPLGRERVVVVGGGFLGTNIARRALALGLPTIVLTRRASAEHALLGAGARIVVGDASDPDTVRSVLRLPAHVVYCAGGRLPTESVDDPVGDAVGTLAPLLCVLEELRRRRGSRLTFLSSGGTVYGSPETDPVDEDHPCRPLVPYGVSRLAAEAYVNVYSTLHAVCARILRLGNVYGPAQPLGRRQGIVAALLAAARTSTVAEIWGDGRVARDYLHVDDVADVVHRLPEPRVQSEILNVGTGVAPTVREVIAAVERVSGTSLRVEFRPGRAYDVERIALSTRRIEALIPYSPLALEDGLTLTWLAQTIEIEEGAAAEGP